jgi:hypothetical protein
MVYILPHLVLPFFVLFCLCFFKGKTSKLLKVTVNFTGKGIALDARDFLAGKMGTGGISGSVSDFACMLHSPTHPYGLHLPSVHLQAFSSLLHSATFSIDSRWSALVEFGLNEIEEVNWWILGGLQKCSTKCIHKGLNMQPPILNDYISNSCHSLLDHMALKYWTNGFPMCYISSNLGNVSKFKRVFNGDICL